MLPFVATLDILQVSVNNQYGKRLIGVLYALSRNPAYSDRFGVFLNLTMPRLKCLARGGFTILRALWAEADFARDCSRVCIGLFNRLIGVPAAPWQAVDLP